MKEDKFLDKVLIAVGIFDLIFVIAMVVIFCIFQTVPDTLIVSVIGATFGECGCCAYVFKQKVRHDTEDIDDIPGIEGTIEDPERYTYTDL